jgi:hypothetical protein
VITHQPGGLRVGSAAGRTPIRDSSQVVRRHSGWDDAFLGFLVGFLVFGYFRSTFTFGQDRPALQVNGSLSTAREIHVRFRLPFVSRAAPQSEATFRRGLSILALKWRP